MSIQNCGPDCWLMKAHPNAQDSFDNYHAAALPTSSQLPQPLAEAAKDLYKTLYPWQTRLVRLEPGSFQEPLRCKLLTADITHMEGLGVHEYSSMLEYEALSYCWGNPVFDHALQCEDLILPITQNLATALWHLRYPDKPRHLWIDALCICQHDNKEKAHQVQNMFAIFRKAKSVVAWLGPQSPNTRLAFQLLTSWKELERDFRDSGHGHGLACLEQLGSAYSAVQELWLCPWFRRTWIRQEAFGSKHLILLCGKITDNWRNFPNLCNAISQIENIERVLADASITFEKLDVSILRSIDVMKTPITEDVTYFSLLLYNRVAAGSALWTKIFLDGSAYFEKSELRDGVYAYIGLANEVTRLANTSALPIKNSAHGFEFDLITDHILKGGATPLPVDYSKSISEVYQDVAKYLINRFCNLGPLMVLESRRNRNPDLPSWVTDYRERKPRLLNIMSGCVGPDRKQDLSQTNKLVLMGTRVGVVGAEMVGKLKVLGKGVFGSASCWCYYLNVDQEIETFKASGSYKYRVPCLSEKLGHWTYKRKSGTPKWILVADGVQAGDLIVLLERGNVPFILREIHKDEGALEYLFLGPAVLKYLWDYYRWEFHDEAMEEFVLV